MPTLDKAEETRQRHWKEAQMELGEKIRDIIARHILTQGPVATLWAITEELNRVRDGHTHQRAQSKESV